MELPLGMGRMAEIYREKDIEKERENESEGERKRERDRECIKMRKNNK